ncbi:SDR family NAD(P)-dependent oxidoreductase [Actinokineospora bangkokensis]|uniref:Ketoreductase n=1 Tax=Actinokineospora bangkokensis TaxID=1193682 RepID=A0A1Q9LSN2_9PSEU|nr:SDR family oxidoreductase [Actinokineospora bangkokensis]OLR95045.1 hypothetical protein BJP25_08805 [Actinokineospora bangkokensis]
MTQRGAIVTGGGTGIGRAIALDLAQDHDVLVVGRTESTVVDAARHPRVHPLVLDVTAPGAPAALAAAARKSLGQVNVLVNNAGSAAPAPLGGIDPASAHAQIAVNLTAPLLLTQELLPDLKATRGVVLNLTSAGSTGGRAWPGFSAYGAAKAALEFLTRTWAAELAPHGVRVLALAPGVVESGMGLRMGSTPEEYARFLAETAGTTPLRRVGQPSEMAWWVRTLLDPRATFATGAVVVADGGMSL